METESDLASISFYGRYTTGVSVRNAIAELELSVGLSRVRSTLGMYVWEIKECCPVGD